MRMAEQQTDSEKNVKKIFDQYKPIMLKIQEIITKQKHILVIKKQIAQALKQREELREYNTRIKKLIQDAKFLESNVPYMKKATEDMKKSIIKHEKFIARLKSNRNLKSNPSIIIQKRKVNSSKTMLVESYDKHLKLILEKENKLLELKNKIKEYDCGSIMTKEKAELDGLIKMEELLKSKIMHANEIISMTLEKKLKANTSK